MRGGWDGHLKATSNKGHDIKVPSSESWTAVEPLQPRAIGAGNVVVKAANGVTRIADLRQSGSLRLVFPQTRRTDVEAVIVNTAGGLTGGDRISIRAEAQAGASLTLTTQAAERAYRTQPGEVASLQTDILVGPSARVNWLPQELILYDGANLERSLHIDLADTARLLMVEPVIFGRTAMHETLKSFRFRDRIEISRAGAPLYTDALSLSGSLTDYGRGACLPEAGALATLVFVAPEAEAHVQAVRALLPETGGASLLRSDLLAVRMLATDGFELRAHLLPILDRLSGDSLPKSWRL